MGAMRILVERYDDDSDPGYSPWEAMRTCVPARRSARRRLAACYAYLGVLAAACAAMLVSTLAFGLVVAVPLLAAYSALAGWFIGRQPWAALRQDASTREMWYAMSHPLLRAATERADGIEAAILRGLSNAVANDLRLAPRDRAMRIRHLGHVADAMQSIHDPRVLAHLVAHVQLAAAGLGADLEETRP